MLWSLPLKLVTSDAVNNNKLNFFIYLFTVITSTNDTYHTFKQGLFFIPRPLKHLLFLFAGKSVVQIRASDGQAAQQTYRIRFFYRIFCAVIQFSYGLIFFKYDYAM